MYEYGFSRELRAASGVVVVRWYDYGTTVLSFAGDLRCGGWRRCVFGTSAFPSPMVHGRGTAACTTSASLRGSGLVLSRSSSVRIGRNFLSFNSSYTHSSSTYGIPYSSMIPACAPESEHTPPRLEHARASFIAFSSLAFFPVPGHHPRCGAEHHPRRRSPLRSRGSVERSRQSSLSRRPYSQSSYLAGASAYAMLRSPMELSLCSCWCMVTWAARRRYARCCGALHMHSYYRLALFLSSSAPRSSWPSHSPRRLPRAHHAA